MKKANVVAIITVVVFAICFFSTAIVFAAGGGHKDSAVAYIQGVLDYCEKQLDVLEDNLEEDDLRAILPSINEAENRHFALRELVKNTDAYFAADDMYMHFKQRREETETQLKEIENTRNLYRRIITYINEAKWLETASGADNSMLPYYVITPFAQKMKEKFPDFIMEVETPETSTD